MVGHFCAGTSLSLSCFLRFIKIAAHTSALSSIVLLLSAVSQPSAKMINDEGVMVDLYIPRKCAWTNKLITAKDHASVQVNVGHLDENGVYNQQFTTFAMTGKVRAMGEADSALDIMFKKRVAEGTAQ